MCWGRFWVMRLYRPNKRSLWNLVKHFVKCPVYWSCLYFVKLPLSILLKLNRTEFIRKSLPAGSRRGWTWYASTPLGHYLSHTRVGSGKWVFKGREIHYLFFFLNDISCSWYCIALLWIFSQWKFTLSSRKKRALFFEREVHLLLYLTH